MVNNISPVSIWKEGATQSATKLFLRVVADDLETSAVFYYEMRSADDIAISNGNLVLSDAAYTAWNTGSNSTPAAFTWAATELNLTLI